MRIGFDYRLGGNINAGIGRYSFELLIHLLRNNVSDEYFVFYNKNNVTEADLETFRKLGATTVATSIRHYSLAEQLFLPRILHSYKLGIMHFPNFNVPLRYNRPYIVTIHDMVHHKISGHKRSRQWKFEAYKYIIAKAAERAVKILTVTEFAKKEIVTYLNVPPEKVKVIYEAPASAPLKPSDVVEIKKRYRLSRPYILFVGTLERKKNLPMLAKGFDLFIEKYRYDMDLVVAGKQDRHYPEVKEQMLGIKNRGRLVFTGYVSDEDQAALYMGAYAFVTPSLHEGFGLPGLEAMQYGVPVLASNTEVFNEVYDYAALYFDPLNPDDLAKNLALLADDQPFYEQMRQKGLDRIRFFDWNRTAQETLEEYRAPFRGQFKPENE